MLIGPVAPMGMKSRRIRADLEHPPWTNSLACQVQMGLRWVNRRARPTRRPRSRVVICCV